MQLIQLQKELINLNLEIFTLNDLVKITGQKKEILKVFLNNQIKKNNLIRLKKNYYTFKQIDNKFKLTSLYKNSYLALNSALEFYQTTTQKYNTLELISNKTLSSKNINGIKIKNYKIKNKLFFGYEKHKVDNIDFFVSNLEKTIIDCVYFQNQVYLSETLKFIKLKKNKLNKTKIEDYLKKINSTILTKRVGYLLELENTHIDDFLISNKYEKLNYNLKSKGIKNKKWKLIINEDL
jgi:predicted transcriptional regulator of viral defense system